jgi:hypothetical protein
VEKKKIMVDPPQGYLYGFPKACPQSILHDEKKFGTWLTEQGYPDANPPYIRAWEEEA